MDPRSIGRHNHSGIDSVWNFCCSKYTEEYKPEQNPEEQNTSVSENSTSDENTAENSTDDPDIIVKDNVKVRFFNHFSQKGQKNRTYSLFPYALSHISY